MGNHLAATAPSQILGAESYLADANDYVFEKSLGSTRFMKVARAKYQEGYAVVKVFVIPDPSVDLDSYKAEVEMINSQLKQASNCIPFQKTIITDRAALLIRQFAKYNLYDRISTRPFYHNIERRWAAFQLLCALNQIAKFKIWHGDIKSENVLITSWNWLLLSDFGSYKPMYLPDDNPADFNYFFDTSRRRTCYIAPERFTDQSATLSSNKKQMTDHDSSATHAMDIFSAGCVIAELFTDGSALFDLSQLLAYRENKFYPDTCLSKIEDLHIRSLVEHMIQINPSERYTAERYLTLWKGNAFPDHFYTYLKFYLGKFCELPLMSADQTVSLLHADLEKILHNLVYKEESAESLVIIASLLISCTRKLKYVNGKLKALHLIVEFAKHLKSDIILERFVPYLMELVKDRVTRVKARALSSLATCLTFVSKVPRGESNIFSEYILPGISSCAKDPSVPVRQAFAENIAIFAESALRFLDSSQNSNDSSYVSALGGDQVSYDSQLQLLRLMVQNRVQVLFSDPDSTVRQCLLEFSVPRLCAFFGKQKANDVLLSHMITFLNDKQDWQLRASFFTSLVSVAAYIGWQSSHILKPLLQQGLSDFQEFVVSQTLTAIASLVELGLLQKQLVCELIKDNVLFLTHPCDWIRQNTVSFLCSCARTFDPVDTHCYILPMISPFLEHTVVQAERERIVLNALRPFIKYSIFELVCNAPNSKAIFTTLHARKEQRAIKSSSETNVPEDDGNDDLNADSKTKTIIRKLILKEMTENDEDMLLHYEQFLSKKQKSTQNSASSIASTEWQNGDVTDDSVIDVPNLVSLRHHADMVTESEVSNLNKSLAKKAANRKKSVQIAQPHDMNDEWKTMFGTDGSKQQSGLALASAKKGSSANISISMSQLESANKPAFQSLSESKQPNIQYKYASCKLDLRALVHHRRDLYKSDVAQRELEEQADNNGLFPVTDWKPSGQLVAHMKEHRGPIHKVAISPANNHFVTVSSDRSLRLWQAEKLEGKAVVNRSKAVQTFSSALKGVTFCDDDTVLCSSDDGNVHSLSVELMGSRSVAEKPESMPTPSSAIRFSHSVNLAVQGRITDLKSVVNSQLVIYSTSHGTIMALDMRNNKHAWELKHNMSHGLPTTFCVDPKQHWLCIGTARGTHICWDLRFQLPITNFSHPSSASVRRVTTHPNQPSCIVSVVTGNNEVSIWDIETGTRQMALWASTAPPLSLTQKSADSVNGLCAALGSDGIRLFTGGTDSKIRLWDLGHTDRSRIVCGPELGNSRSCYSPCYVNRLVDGTQVVQEQIVKSRREDTEEATQSQSEQSDDVAASNARSRIGEQAVPLYHHDVITDIATFHVNQTFLVSTARDGVVKIWK